MDRGLLAYLPQDRRRALSDGTPVPAETSGAALFADCCKRRAFARGACYRAFVRECGDGACVA